MKRDDPEIRARVDQFINSKRNEETKQYAKEIINFLSKADPAKEQGWIRVKEMQAALVGSGDIPFNTTFFRLLEDLTKAKIIERKEAEREPGARGKRPIYYRVPFYYPPEWFLSRDELLNELDQTEQQTDSERWEKIILLRILRKIVKQNPEINIFELIQEQKEHLHPFWDVTKDEYASLLFEDPVLRNTYEIEQLKRSEEMKDKLISILEKVEKYFKK